LHGDGARRVNLIQIGGRFNFGQPKPRAK
jgi:hypothetical protein